MKQEFVTVRGKAIIENKSLFVRNLKSSFWNTLAGKLLYPTVVLAFIVLRLISADRPYDYFVAGMFVIVFSNHLTELYDILFRRSFAGRIPLHRIKSFETKPDEFGLDTEIILHLKNGRYRSIPFRTLENQYQPFTELLSQSIAQPQFA